VRGSSFPLRSFSLYDPFPSAYVTSYGPSHLGPSFLVSSAWLASLLRIFPFVSCFFASLMAACSRFSSSSSKLISNASSFLAMSNSDVLNVGIPISAGMTASVSLAFIPSPKLRFALSTSPFVSSEDVLRRQNAVFT
ncbi:hypothetical protein Tco_0101842, partial [Tanacetum coccineum]